ncbi:MAG: hypothetical protein NT139_02180 [Candidatus Woesearchaeota archaeon]|nr:hypothetical protein [Candidatus Woesearchaeota archaeon]
MLIESKSMEECIYFTNRPIDSKGKAKCWVYRQKCPKCGKALMSKPRDSKGKIKIRANEYVCPECGYKVEKDEYESSLTAYIKYTCPKCEYNGEIEIPFKRKKVQGVEALKFECQKCKNSIYITKKMKELKNKGED